MVTRRASLRLIRRAAAACILVVAVCVPATLTAVPVDAPVADAAMRGDAETVRSLLRQGADVNVPQADGMTALHWAAANDAGSLAEILIYAGARLDVGTRIGNYTPLHLAAKEGHSDVLAVLLEAGGNVNATTAVAGVAPLHFAAATGDVETIRVLLDHGALVDGREAAWEQTPLMYAAAAGRLQAVELLLASGADVSLTAKVVDVVARDEADRAAIRLRNQRRAALRKVDEEAAAAAAEDEAEAGEDEAEAGEDEAEAGEGAPAEDEDNEPVEGEESGEGEEPGEPEGGEQTAENEESAGSEEGEGADASAEGEDAEESEKPAEDGDAAEAEEPAEGEGAAGTEHPEDSDEPEDAEGGEGEGEGKGEGEDEGEGEGEKSGAEGEDKADEEPERPPTYAELVGGHGGLTPLLYASREGYTEVVTTLLDAGADINQASESDHTSPLLIATLNGHFDLAMALLERGADPNVASDAGTAPLYAALNVRWAPRSAYPQQNAYKQQRTGYTDLMAALLETGAEPTVRLTKHLWYTSFNFDSLLNSAGGTPFWRAAYALDVDAMQLLVEHGADPEVPTEKLPRRGRPRPQGEDGKGEDEADASGLPEVPVGGPAIFPIHAASGAGYGEGFAANFHRHAPDGWMPAVKYLVEELGADVNARDHNAYSPLHHAAARGDFEMILYLVSKGADVTLVSRKGQTTADMANGPVQRIQPYSKAVWLLERLGSKNNDNCVSC